MNSLIKKAITEFHYTQRMYAKWGAYDSEPNQCFNDVIKSAVNGVPISWVAMRSMHNTWDLYSSVPGYRAINDKLTSSAKKVYNAIKKHGKIEDLPLLRSYYE
jgi:hypothetical protein